MFGSLNVNVAILNHNITMHIVWIFRVDIHNPFLTISYKIRRFFKAHKLLGQTGAVMDTPLPPQMKIWFGLVKSNYIPTISPFWAKSKY